MTPDAIKAEILDEMIETSKGRIIALTRPLEDEKRWLGELEKKRKALDKLLPRELNEDRLSLPLLTTPTLPETPPLPMLSPSEWDLQSENGFTQPRTIVSLVDQILRNSNGPLTLAELAAEVKKLGGKTNSVKGMAGVIASVMFKYDDRYVRVGRATYDLIERHNAFTINGRG